MPICSFRKRLVKFFVENCVFPNAEVYDAAIGR